MEKYYFGNKNYLEIRKTTFVSAPYSLTIFAYGNYNTLYIEKLEDIKSLIMALSSAYGEIKFPAFK